MRGSGVRHTCAFRYSSVIAISCGFLVGLAATTNAATAEPDQVSQLDEIVVTASKRETSIQNLSMSVTVLGAETLALMGVEAINDLVTAVPNLSFGFADGGARDGRNSRSFAIRGVSGNSTTGFYVDETPLANFVEPRMVDVARVEVLRGPQGSLYGASSMGGTIRLISNEVDTETFSGLVDGRISNTDNGDLNYQLEAVLNIPMSDERTALRLVGYMENTDGVFNRNHPDAMNPAVRRSVKNVDTRVISGIQASYKYVPFDNLELGVKLAHHQHESDGAPWTGQLGDFEQNRAFDIPETLDDEWTHAALTAIFSTERLNFSSNTAYFTRDFMEFEDVSEIVGQFFGGFLYPVDVNQEIDEDRLIQEFRVSSAIDSHVRYILGLYYADIDTSSPSSAVPVGFEAGFASFIGQPGAPVFGGSDVVFDGISDLGVRELALFGEVMFDLSERLSLTVGGRWFNVDIDRFIRNVGIVADGNTTTGSASESGTNPKVALEFAISETAMLYGSASKGYRYGGISPFVPDFCGPDLAAPSKPFDSDTLWSYELGAKSTWMNNTWRLNGAVFHIDWDDIQQNRNLSCGFGQIINVGKARSRGFEIELAAAPLAGLELTTSVGFSDAEIRSTESGIVPKTGDRLLHVPDWTAHSSVYYRFPVRFADAGYVYGTHTFVGNSVTRFTDDPIFSATTAIRGSYNLWNVRVGAQVGDWNASLFVDNVFDEQANLSEVPSLAADVEGLEGFVTNRPRTIGLQLKWAF